MSIPFLITLSEFNLIEFEDFTILFSGFLLTLSVYHFLLYFQHKDRVYLFYSLYTFLIFTSSYPDTESSFFSDATSNSNQYLHLIIIPREWIYNTLYLIFAKTLVELHIYKPKWDRILNISVVILFTVLILAMIYALLTGENVTVGIIFSYFFSPTIAVLALISFYVLYTMETPIKYYVLIGSFVYMVLAESAFYFSFDEETATVIFYVGIIIENIFFSLGLGHKQKLILEDKNDSQKKLIKQLEENEKLKSKVRQQLEQNVVILSKKAETEKLEKVKVAYEKELIELKMASLRSQMNPHFIFNSLNAIKLYIIDNEKENAVYYLNKFSKLIRKILATTREKEITLADEIETLKLYIDIENIRFSNEIQSSISIDETLGINTIKIPSLILQPFIENAIWHGLSPQKGLKKIDIDFEKEENTHLKITIADNGIGRKKSNEINSQKIHKKDSIGIKLTEERLNNFCKSFENDYSLKFIDLFDDTQASLGTKVVLQIPLK